MDKNNLEESRRLNFNEKFESSEPGIAHRFSFEFAKNYLINKNVLDIGCWTGGFEHFLEQLPCRVTAVELEKKALNLARIKYPQFNLVEASVFKLPFADQSFQAATMWLVLEHLPDNTEKQAFLEINRVLEPGGYFLLSTPFYHWLNNSLDLAYHFVNHRHYKKNELFEILNQSDFIVEKFTVRGGIFSLLSGWLSLFFKYFLRKPVPKIIWFEKLISKEFEKDGVADFYIVARKK